MYQDSLVTGQGEGGLNLRLWYPLLVHRTQDSKFMVCELKPMPFESFFLCCGGR